MRPQETVWDFIIGPYAISQCVPGLESIEVMVPNERFSVVASIGFGSVKVRFTSEIELVELSPPNRAKIKVHGTAPGSAVDASSEIIISQNLDGSTELNWTADVTVVGTIASLASRMMGAVTKKVSAALFECIKGKIEE